MISGNRMHLSNICVVTLTAFATSVMAKAVNTFVIFPFFLLNGCAKISQKRFAHYRYGVLCVEF